MGIFRKLIDSEYKELKKFEKIADQIIEKESVRNAEIFFTVLSLRLYTISGLRAIGFYITEKAVIKVNRLIKQTILASIVILLAICCF